MLAAADGTPLLLTPQSWALWLAATAGALRVDCLARRVCGAADEYAMLGAVNAACAPTGDNATASALFSIYIHPSPLHRGYPRGSIFRGREISPRVKVEWGSWAIMEVGITPFLNLCSSLSLLRLPITRPSSVSPNPPEGSWQGCCLSGTLPTHVLHLRAAIRHDGVVPGLVLHSQKVGAVNTSCIHCNALSLGSWPPGASAHS